MEVTIHLLWQTQVMFTLGDLTSRGSWDTGMWRTETRQPWYRHWYQRLWDLVLSLEGLSQERLCKKIRKVSENWEVMKILQKDRTRRNHQCCWIRKRKLKKFDAELFILLSVPIKVESFPAATVVPLPLATAPKNLFTTSKRFTLCPASDRLSESAAVWPTLVASLKTEKSIYGALLETQSMSRKLKSRFCSKFLQKCLFLGSKMSKLQT